MWNLSRSCSCPALSRCSRCSSFSLSAICRTCLQWFRRGRFCSEQKLWKAVWTLWHLHRSWGLSVQSHEWLEFLIRMYTVFMNSFIPSAGRVRERGRLWRHLCFCGLGAWQLPQAPLLVNGRVRFPCASAAQKLSIPSKEVSLACRSWLFPVGTK